MRSRLPLILSATALVVSIFGTTSVGRSAIDAVIPLAKRAYLADTAKNAIRVNNIKASRTPVPGMLLPLDGKGKLPPEVGAVGPAGAAGPKGDPGKNGATKVIVRSMNVTGAGQLSDTISCKGDERAIGGGYDAGGNGYEVYTLKSKPFPATDGATPTGWTAAAVLRTNAPMYGAIYVICASP